MEQQNRRNAGSFIAGAVAGSTISGHVFAGDGDSIMQGGEDGVSGVTVTVKPDTLALTGHKFTGWNTQADGLGEMYQPGKTLALGGDTALYAIWAPDSYTITFNYRGAATGNEESRRTLEHNATYGGKALLPTPGKTGYTFRHWTYSATALPTTNTGRVLNTSRFTLGRHAILYAQWVPKGGFTVKYDAAGGTGSLFDRTSVGWADTNLLPAQNPAYEGYAFGGWRYGGAAVTAADSYGALAQSETATAITLVAEWVRITDKLVKYDTAGGAPIADKNGVRPGDSGLVPETDPTRAGYTFAGWTYGATSVTSDTVYSALTDADEVTLRAN